MALVRLMRLISSSSRSAIRSASAQELSRILWGVLPLLGPRAEDDPLLQLREPLLCVGALHERLGELHPITL